jgi:hypothetical protein
LIPLILTSHRTRPVDVACQEPQLVAQ